MPEARSTVFKAAVPIVSVVDLAAALDFYQRVLGFEAGWRWGDPPKLASVCRNGVEVNLSQSGPGTPRAISP